MQYSFLPEPRHKPKYDNPQTKKAHVHIEKYAHELIELLRKGNRAKEFVGALKDREATGIKGHGKMIEGFSALTIERVWCPLAFFTKCFY